MSTAEKGHYRKATGDPMTTENNRYQRSEAASVATLKATYEPGDEARCTECQTAVRLSSDRDWRGDLIWRHVITGAVWCHYRATPPPFRAGGRRG